MPYTIVTLASNDPRTVMQAADLPFVLARNILENKQANNLPIWNATGWVTDSDISRAGFPAYYASDLRADLPTTVDPTLDTHFSGLASATDLYLIFDQKSTYPAGAGAGGGNKADTLVVWIANLQELLTAGIAFQWEIANSLTSPGSGIQAVARWTPSLPSAFNFGNLYTPNQTTNGRPYCFQLDNVADSGIAEIDNVEFMRLHFSGTSGIFASHQPVVTEVWFGPKIPLPRSPTINSRVPFRMRDFDPSIGKFEAISAQRADVSFAESRTAPKPAWDPFAPGTDPKYGSFNVSLGGNLWTHYRHSRHGNKPFIYVPNPNSAPDLVYLYQLDVPGPWGLERVEGNTALALAGRRWVELPPFVEDETQDTFAGEIPY